MEGHSIIPPADVTAQMDVMLVGVGSYITGNQGNGTYTPGRES